MASSEVIFLIPAFNEANAIRAVVNRFPPGSVLVVDDGSSDGTSIIAKAAGARILRIQKNQGYDNALMTGLNWCKSEGRNLVVTLDADGQHDSSDAEVAANLLRAGHKLVIGSRQTLARFGERVFAMYGRIRFQVKDPLCGLKGYNLEDIESVDIKKLEGSVGAGLALAILRAGKGFAQPPVKVAPRAEGGSRFGSGARANLKILSAVRIQLGLDARQLFSLENPRVR